MDSTRFKPELMMPTQLTVPRMFVNPERQVWCIVFSPMQAIADGRADAAQRRGGGRVVARRRQACHGTCFVRTRHFAVCVASCCLTFGRAEVQRQREEEPAGHHHHH